MTDLVRGKLNECIVKFLGSLDQPIEADDFPQSIIDAVPSYTKGSKLYDLMQLLQFESCEKYVSFSKQKYSLNNLGKAFLDSIQTQTHINATELEKNTEREEIQDKIATLTLNSLELQKANAELTTKLAEAQLKLSKEQSEEIPKNAQHRYDTLVWQIATGVLAIVAFLLKLFGVKGWL